MEEEKKGSGAAAKNRNRRRKAKAKKAAENPPSDPTDTAELPETDFETELEWCVNQVLIGLTKNEVTKP
jgi:hypothetical protein